MILLGLRLLFVEISVRVNRERLRRLKRVSGRSRGGGSILKRVQTKGKMSMNALRHYLLAVSNSS